MKPFDWLGLLLAIIEGFCLGNLFQIWIRRNDCKKGKNHD
jgi:hypothetical protein